ncbi:MAG: RNA polymerase sigma factor [Spirochaetes bacterium]|nr:MAG: RNA polymerase sigma factor [Spirochaetota bacterium]
MENITEKPVLSQEHFAEIYTDNFNKVFSFSLRIVGDTHLAEDITQETFIQVYHNYHTFREESLLSTWILTITRNICYRNIRKAKRSSFRSIENLIKTKSSPYHESPDGMFEKQYYTDQIKEGCLLGLLRSLSFFQRSAFILNVLNDLPVTVVSTILEKSDNSTRILIHRARHNLKNFLCGNCSLYQKGNACRCENLIEFSLKQGWIKKYNPAIPIKKVEQELKEFKDEILLYKTLPDNGADETLAARCATMIKNHASIIFSDKKVK